MAQLFCTIFCTVFSADLIYTIYSYVKIQLPLWPYPTPGGHNFFVLCEGLEFFPGRGSEGCLDLPGMGDGGEGSHILSSSNNHVSLRNLILPEKGLT